MKFKGKAGKQVMCATGIITFKSDTYETSKDAEIAALSKAKGVKKTQSQSKTNPSHGAE